jgi:alpha-galactosidase
MRELPVIYNDYMNTLMGDPTTDRLLPLIDAAAEVGAEYLCIDAGWYDDSGSWWDSVGAWEPSNVRFPGGLDEVLDHIRSAGMRPGLWLEPEVIGVRSPVARTLPDEAFFQRDGRRLAVSDRYHLDLRHPAAVDHLDAVIDRLVGQLGVAYLKLDHNIDPGHGTDVDADSLGDGLLGHNRAYLRWLDGVLDRHPQLVLENCASGAMRMDPALLARLQLQSTTDQQNPDHYPPVAAAAPMLVPPEQAGNWAYPQPDMDDEAIVFTLCTGLAGRLYLSGHLDQMSAHQRAIVADGVAAAKRLRADQATGLPIWPLGLPGWDDPWIASGWRPATATTVVVWHRGPDPDRIVLPLPHLRGREARAVTAFPTQLAPAATSWEPEDGMLAVDSPGGPFARVLTIT